MQGRVQPAGLGFWHNKKLRYFAVNAFALVGIALLNRASTQGLSQPYVSFWCIPLTMMWFYALEGFSNPGHEDRTVSTLHAAACGGFVGWLLHSVFA